MSSPIKLNFFSSSLVAIFGFLVSCAEPPPPNPTPSYLQKPSVSPAQLAAAEYGPPPTRDQMIRGMKAVGNASLVDPYSAVYSLHGAKPAKAWADLNFRKNPRFGWLFIGYINAKNRMGGYTGQKPYFFLWSNGSCHAITFSHSPRSGKPVNYDFEFTH